MAVRGQKHKTAPITLCMWDLSVAIRYTYACTVIGEVPNKTHCAGFLLYSWCRYSFYYKQHTCCYYQCHGSSLLRYTLFVFVSFLAQATICIELFTYEGESIIIRTLCLISIKKQGQRSYNHIIFQHSPLALQCTLSITAQSALWPQNKRFWADRQATHAPLHPVAGPW